MNVLSYAFPDTTILAKYINLNIAIEEQHLYSRCTYG